MQHISDLKSNLINLISSISNYDRLLALYQQLRQETEEVAAESVVEEPLVDKFALGQVEIREGVTKEDIFAEQGKTPLTIDELEELVGDLEWNHSAEELLEFLK